MHVWSVAVWSAAVWSAVVWSALWGVCVVGAAVLCAGVASAVGVATAGGQLMLAAPAHACCRCFMRRDAASSRACAACSALLRTW